MYGTPIVVVAALAVGIITPRLHSQIASGCAPIARHCAPRFRLQGTNSSWLSLNQLRGRGVALNFWAVSCPPCWQEEPALKRAARVFQSRNFALVGIDAWAESASFVRSYLRHDPFPYTTLIDPTQRVADAYNGWRTPETVFVNPRGRVTAIHIGPISYQELSRQIARISPAGRYR